MAEIDIDNLLKEKDNLEGRNDTLAVVISEAEAEQTKIAARLTQVDNMIAYLQGGGDDTLTYLDDIENYGIEAIEDSKLVHTWDAVDNATAYVLRGSTTSDFAVSYEVYTGALLTFEQTELNGTPLEEGVTYYFQLYAVGTGYGNSDTVSNSALVIAKLASVENFNLVAAPDVISGSWDDQGDGGIVYEVYRNTVNNLGTANLLMYASSAGFGDNTVLPATTYYYWVIATKTLSINSDPVTASETSL